MVLFFEKEVSVLLRNFVFESSIFNKTGGGLVNIKESSDQIALKAM